MKYWTLRLAYTKEGHTIGCLFLFSQATGDLASMASDSADQQAAVGAIKDEDGFNWG